MGKEEKLHGGNVNEILRVGDTVHRSAEWNANIHSLLKYLQLKGFEGAPRYIGIDEEGREILSFIPGEVPGNDYPNCKPYVWSDNTLILVAKYLRGLHDVTKDYLPIANAAKWLNPYIEENEYEVICHNDAALYNFVFRDELPVALIDFDTACPGPRYWDIAYTLYTTVPLSSFEPDLNTSLTMDYIPELHAENRHRRISLFFQSYGLKVPDDLKQWVIKRIIALCDTLITGAAKGNAAYQRMIDEGHVSHYQNEILFLQEHFTDWYKKYSKMG